MMSPKAWDFEKYLILYITYLDQMVVHFGAVQNNKHPERSNMYLGHYACHRTFKSVHWREKRHYLTAEIPETTYWAVHLSKIVQIVFLTPEIILEFYNQNSNNNEQWRPSWISDSTDSWSKLGQLIKVTSDMIFFPSKPKNPSY